MFGFAPTSPKTGEKWGTLPFLADDQCTARETWATRQERKDCDDCELLIGVYSSESEAQAAIERVKGQKGFANFPEGFHIYPHELNKDSWTQGFIVD